MRLTIKNIINDAQIFDYNIIIFTNYGYFVCYNNRIVELTNYIQIERAVLNDTKTQIVDMKISHTDILNVATSEKQKIK